MGQKINPISLRLQNTNRYFDFCWYNDFFYSELFLQDLKIQKYLNSIFKQIKYPTGRFFIQTSQKKIKIFIFFCSPLKSRKIRSNYFKTKFYKITKKTFLKKKSKISDFLRLHTNLSHSIYNTQDRITTFDKSKSLKTIKDSFVLPKLTSINRGDRISKFIKQKKIPYLKYLLYKKFLQKVYTSTQETRTFKSQLSNFYTNSQILLTQPELIQTEILYKKLRKSKIYPTFFFNNEFFFNGLKGYFDLKYYQSISRLPYRKYIEKVLAKKLSIDTNLHAVKTYDHFRSASFLAEEIVYYLEKRIPFRRIKNRILKEVKLLPSIRGIRIACSGRVGGRSKKAQRSKTEMIKYGQTSLHVFSSRIDFVSRRALTGFGLIGIKVWVCYK